MGGSVYFINISTTRYDKVYSSLFRRSCPKESWWKKYYFSYHPNFRSTLNPSSYCVVKLPPNCEARICILLRPSPSEFTLIWFKPLSWMRNWNCLFCSIKWMTTCVVSECLQILVMASLKIRQIFCRFCGSINFLGLSISILKSCRLAY